MRGGTLDIESFPGTWRTFGDRPWEAKLISEVTPNTPASFSFKPYPRGKIITKGVWEFKTQKEFMRELWKVFDENDFIIGHNVKRFDHLQSNTFFAQYDLPAPSPCEYQDTLKIVKANFRLPYYNLKYCLAFFKVGHKMETGGDKLWVGAEGGDEHDRRMMLRYNQNDTVQTEKLWTYLQEQGWVSKAPWHKSYTNKGCPRCKERRVQKRGIVSTSKGKVQMYSCKNCDKRLEGELVQEWSVRS